MILVGKKILPEDIILELQRHLVDFRDRSVIHAVYTSQCRLSNFTRCLQTDSLISRLHYFIVIEILSYLCS